MVRDAINYIDFNLTEDLSLNAIAEKLSVSASYLSKQFKNENNKTLTNYVNEKRVFTSLKYLATTDLPIQNVAELVGIYDENYFSRLFKKYQNITPSKYRNLMRRDSN
jgi:YesN/AraC family two-component response regulator